MTLPEVLARKPQATVVLLGASNLTRGIAPAVACVQRLLGSPLDFYVALGHGRSYGQRSSVLMRELPGIRECALWEDLQKRDPNQPVYALIADIGNDILYQTPVATIVDWLCFALDQLQALRANVTILQLPVHNILHTSNFQFGLLKYVLYPGRQLDKAVVQRHALQLAEAIRDLSQRYQTQLVEHDPSWYGIDPIHFRRSSRYQAWQHIISGWARSGQSLEVLSQHLKRPGIADEMYLSARAPALRWLFGKEQRRPQPCGQLWDGSQFRLY